MFDSIHRDNFSDAAIRQFLLARLAADDRAAFEQSLFTSAVLEHRVRLAEIELTDDYVFRRLHRSEAHLFERHFLLSADRLRVLSTSRALRAQYQPLSAPQGLSLIRSWFSLKFGQRASKVAFAAVLLILTIGGAWLVVRKEPQIRQEITKRLNRKRTSPQPTPAEAHHATNGSAPEHQESPQLLTEHETTPRAFTIALNPNDRENAPSISLRDAENDVTFELAINGGQISEFRSEVMTAQGEAVYRGAAAVGASSAAVNLNVPAVLLKPGEYEIRLIDARSNARTASYYFHVK